MKVIETPLELIEAIELFEIRFPALKGAPRKEPDGMLTPDCQGEEIDPADFCPRWWRSRGFEG